MTVIPSPVCDQCGGSGWVTRPGSLDAHPCSCQAVEKKKLRAASASIPKRYVHCTLNNFNEKANVTLTSAKRKVREFIDCWPSAERGLLLMGGCGAGKTHLAVSILQELIATNKPGKVLFSNFQDLIQEIQGSFSSDTAPSKSEILAPLLQTDLLVLDELGSQKPTPFVQDILYYIINTRYNDEKVTIFTTNYVDEPRMKGEERLEDRIGERLRSRLYEMTERVIIEAEDYRRSPRRVV